MSFPHYPHPHHPQAAEDHGAHLQHGKKTDAGQHAPHEQHPPVGPNTKGTERSEVPGGADTAHHLMPGDGNGLTTKAPDQSSVQQKNMDQQIANQGSKGQQKIEFPPINGYDNTLSPSTSCKLEVPNGAKPEHTNRPTEGTIGKPDSAKKTEFNLDWMRPPSATFVPIAANQRI